MEAGETFKYANLHTSFRSASANGASVFVIFLVVSELHSRNRVSLTVV